MATATKNRLAHYTNGRHRQQPEVSVSVETITPEIADEMLARNKSNRKLDERHVAELAEMMRQGMWMLNGETIIIDKHNNLTSGQHRLTAVKEAGVAIQTLVARGLDRSTFCTVDRGKIRTVADNLGLSGESYVNELSNALNLLVRYRGGAMLSRKAKLQPYKALDLLGENQSLRDSVEIGVQCSKFLGKGGAAFCHFIFSEKCKRDANDFFGRLISGEGLKRSDPVYMLREKLIHRKQNKTKMKDFDILSMVFKAWNACRSGRAIAKLQGLRDGEAFPKAL